MLEWIKKKWPVMLAGLAILFAYLWGLFSGRGSKPEDRIAASSSSLSRAEAALWEAGRQTAIDLGRADQASSSLEQSIEQSRGSSQAIGNGLKAIQGTGDRIASEASDIRSGLADAKTAGDGLTKADQRLDELISDLRSASADVRTDATAGNRSSTEKTN